MNLRAASPGDAAGIARVHVASSNAAYRGIVADEALDALTEERLEREWRAEIERPERPGAAVAVVEDAGRVTAYSRYGPARDDDLDPAVAGEIYGFYVDPAAWGRGAGRALMAYVVGDLAARGFRRAALWVVQENPRAQAFYRATGFEADGRDDAVCAGAPEYRFARSIV